MLRIRRSAVFAALTAVTAASASVVSIWPATPNPEVCVDRSNGFASAGGLSLGGSATVGGNVLRLTPAEATTAGVALATEPMDVGPDLGLDSTFTFRVAQRAGIGDEDGPGADGFAFVFQNAAGPTTGAGGGGLGYDGMPNSIAIEFDTYRNAFDPDGSHVSVHTRGARANSADESASIAQAAAMPDFADGRAHTVRVRYLPPDSPDGTGLSVFLDDMSTPVIEVDDLDLARALDLGRGNGYAGFTAGTGGGYETHEILTWRACTTDGVDDVRAADDDLEGVEDVPLEVAAPGVLGNDTVPSSRLAPRISVVTAPEHGELVIGGDGALRYVPARDFAGSDRAVYEVCVRATCSRAAISLWLEEVSYPTKLHARPSIARVSSRSDVFLELSARLTALDQAQAGQTIVFSVAGEPVCSAVTANDGWARCGSDVPTLVASARDNGYEARFAGSPDLWASETRAPAVASRNR